MNQTVISITTDGEFGMVVVNEGNNVTTFRVGDENASELLRDLKEDIICKERYYRDALARKEQFSKFWTGWCEGILDLHCAGEKTNV